MLEFSRFAEGCVQILYAKGKNSVNGLICTVDFQREASGTASTFQMFAIGFPGGSDQNGCRRLLCWKDRSSISSTKQTLMSESMAPSMKCQKMRATFALNPRFC